MTIKQKFLIYKRVAPIALFAFLAQMIFPTVSWALTSGPTQPEFSSFEPVTTTNMVNEFTGDFTYNLPLIEVPGPNGSGYPLSLSYHAGANMEEEASWVGYGWTLNPGAINRVKKGYPDDWEGIEVTKWNKNFANHTVTGSISGSSEAASFDPPVSVGAGIRFNNYQGFGWSSNVGVSLAKGMISIGLSVTNFGHSFSASVSPIGNMDNNKGLTSDGNAKTRNKAVKKLVKGMSKFAKKRKDKNEKLKKTRSSNGLKGTLVGSSYSLWGSMGGGTVNMQPYIGGIFNLTSGLNGTPLAPPVGIQANVSGSYNFQDNDPSVTGDAYGYLYSSTAGDDKDFMDYHYEKGTTYDKLDHFIGLPIGLADNYSVTGEELTGGFRAFHTEVGVFRPNKTASEILSVNIGVEPDVGGNFGVGFDAGVGWQRYKTKKWEDDPGADFSFENAARTTKSNFFKFKHDLGGYIDLDPTNIESPELDYTNSGLLKAAAPGATFSMNNVETSLNDGNIVNRSSAIAYRKNVEIASTTEKESAFERADHGAPRTVGSVSTQIGEFSVANEDGKRYNYGLPVYSLNEKTLSIGVSKATDIENNKLVYFNSEAKNKVRQGEEAETPYATTYLLTSVTTPDYIDLDFDGPTNDDFGGWTKFNYDRVTKGIDGTPGSLSSEFYHWRSPYSGMNYSRNQLSEPKDDMGSYSEGDKELYYLESIETKTHIAIFERSTSRSDAKPAVNSPIVSSNSRAVNTAGAPMQRLDAIVVYAKDPDFPTDPNKYVEIKKVNFKYNQSAWPDLPNAVNNDGKLTLEKLWFEYGGIRKAKISPYTFEYEYTQNQDIINKVPNHYTAKSTGLLLGSAHHSPAGTLIEKPDYSAFAIDAWGNYQINGPARYNDLIPWLDQKDEARDTRTFDPAAWQLKQIKLPSGGEIHVFYDQDDYTHVQAKRAHVMASLTSGSDDVTLNHYYIDYAALGIDAADLDDYRDMIEREYVGTDKKMYFKFLYRLKSSSTPTTPNINNDCNAEYIDGYVKIQSVIRLTSPDALYLVIDNTNSDDLPRSVCKEFVKTHKLFIPLENGACSDASVEQDFEGSEANVIETIVRRMSAGPKIGITRCGAINYGKSYLRLPSFKAKKGGGLRVQYLVSYDPGILTGQSSIYGSEYVYDEWDSRYGRYISSGVATFEPGSIRQENPFVTTLPRYNKSKLDKIISGKDKKSTEGPLGEGLMPSPSVGYGLVTVKSLHSGLSNAGYVEKRFHTAKTDPFQWDPEPIQKLGGKPKMLITGVVNRHSEDVWLSQSNNFYFNNMHGKPKSVTTYRTNDYDDIFNPTSTSEKMSISSERYEYFEPGESIPVMYNVEDATKATPDELPLGQEMEVIYEQRKIVDRMNDGNLETDVNVGFFGTIPVPFGSVMPSTNSVKNGLHMVTMTKVTYYPAIMKSKTLVHDDKVFITSYERFDPLTGKPVITRSYDGFNGISGLPTDVGQYTKYDIMATSEYSDFGQKAGKELTFLDSNDPDDPLQYKFEESGGEFTLSFEPKNPGPIDYCNGAMEFFTAGDLIRIEKNGHHFFHNGGMQGSKIKLIPTDPNKAVGAYPSNGDLVNVHILRSGQLNRLNENVGSFTVYGKDGINITQPADRVARIALKDALNSYLAGGGSQKNYLKDFVDGQGNQLKIMVGGECTNYDEEVYVQLTGPDKNILEVKHDGFNSKKIIYPHPMVGQLNYILQKYFQYPLSSNGANWVCTPTSGNHDGYNYANSANDIVNMHSSINTDLDVVYDDVDGQDNINLNSVFRIPPSYTTTNAHKHKTLANYNNSQSLLEYFHNPDPQKTPASNSIYGFDGACSTEYEILLSSRNTSNPYNVPIGMSDPAFTQAIAKTGFYQDQDGKLRFKSYYFRVWNAPDETWDWDYNDDEVGIEFYDETNKPAETICSMNLYHTYDNTGNSVYGTFDLDFYGNLVYKPSGAPCNPQVITCLPFCSGPTIDAPVITSTASTMDDNWEYESLLGPVDVADANFDNPYMSGEKGKWRTNGTFIYRELASTGKNYETGVFTHEVFNWKNPLANNPELWLLQEDIDIYSPNGNPLESRDILGTPSAVHYTTESSLPYMVAVNSDMRSCSFESFENEYSANGSDYFERYFMNQSSDGSVDPNVAHTGSNSFKVNQATQGIVFNEIHEYGVDPHILDKDIVIRLWARTDGDPKDLIYATNTNNDARFGLRVEQGTATVGSSGNTQYPSNGSAAAPLKVIGQSGEWFLLEYSGSSFFKDVNSTNGPVYFKLEYQPMSGATDDVWIDDLKLQPKDSKASSYVYDRVTNKLLASMDDQHYALIYQYDAEGRLIRKLKETERGVKTLVESHYQSPTVDRP